MDSPCLLLHDMQTDFLRIWIFVAFFLGDHGYIPLAIIYSFWKKQSVMVQAWSTKFWVDQIIFHSLYNVCKQVIINTKNCNFSWLYSPCFSFWICLRQTQIYNNFIFLLSSSENNILPTNVYTTSLIPVFYSRHSGTISIR